VIVNSYSDSMEAIGFLKNSESGRGLFVPLNPKSTPSAPLQLNGTQGIVGKALNFIKCGEDYRPVIELLLGNVVIVQDMDVAMHLHQNPEFQGTVVTLNGDMIESNGFITGGSAKNESSRLLARNREIDSLSESVKELKVKLEESRVKIESDKYALVELETSLKKINEEVHQKELDNNNSLRDLEQLRQEVLRLDDHASNLDTESMSLTQQLQGLENEKGSLSVQLLEMKQKSRGEEESLEKERIELEESRKTLERNLMEISGLKVLVTSLIGRRENTLTEIKRLTLQQKNLQQQIENREKDMVLNQNRIIEIDNDVSVLEGNVLKQTKEKDALNSRAVKEEENLRENEDLQKQTDQNIRELSRKLQEITEILSQIEIKRSEIKLQNAHIEERAYEDFNATREELSAAHDEKIVENEIEESVKDLKEKLARLGEVNLAALSEFEKTNERYTFLKEQQDDLAESIELLHSTIEKINCTTRERFLDTFNKVNENFKEVFARLFQGGKANLTLMDESNPLDSGIEITANPIGKSMQNLSLLSGGEKSMAAIALVFAVFKVRPSPFCLLDEVDAPLDEANVVRFQEMLKEMAVNTQFIIITHNQKTMTFANALYGITMEEKGVSKAVSVNFN
ncbi:MAG: chromosome segregation protein SMC, partial [Nitrospinaceae bacterium]|nr:chromosome segregation protein SMC [Nitrospinaceae bacterium]